MLIDNALVLVATTAAAYTDSTFRTQQNKQQITWYFFCYLLLLYIHIYIYIFGHHHLSLLNCIFAEFVNMIERNPVRGLSV